jgi:hypothetical protein
MLCATHARRIRHLQFVIIYPPVMTLCRAKITIAAAALAVRRKTLLLPRLVPLVLAVHNTNTHIHAFGPCILLHLLYLLHQARLIIDDEVLVSSTVGNTGTASLLLPRGWHDVELHFLEHAGSASVRLAVSVDGGVSGLLCTTHSVHAGSSIFVPSYCWLHIIAKQLHEAHHI